MLDYGCSVKHCPVLTEGAATEGRPYKHIDTSQLIRRRAARGRRECDLDAAVLFLAGNRLVRRQWV